MWVSVVRKHCASQIIFLYESMNTGLFFFAKLHLAVCLPPVPWQQLCGAARKIPSSIISLQYRQENMEALPQASSQYLPNSFPEGEVPIAPCQNVVFIGISC